MKNVEGDDELSGDFHAAACFQPTTGIFIPASSREASKGGAMPNTKTLNTIKVDGCQIYFKIFLKDHLS